MIRSAGQQLPTGIPTEPIVQTGSSITPTFVIVTTGIVLATGILAFVLTREDGLESARAPVRKRRRR